MMGSTVDVNMSFLSAISLYYWLLILIDDLFPCLGKGCMEDFHLLGKELFQPLILLYVIVDELNGQRPCNLYGAFPFLASVEPSFRPPYDAVPVWIYADRPLNIKALDVYLKVGQRV